MLVIERCDAKSRVGQRHYIMGIRSQRIGLERQDERDAQYDSGNRDDSDESPSVPTDVDRARVDRRDRCESDFRRVPPHTFMGWQRGWGISSGAPRRFVRSETVDFVEMTTHEPNGSEVHR